MRNSSEWLRLVMVVVMLFLATASKATVTVSRLRCEYLKDPLGIDVPSPRLSWIIDSDQRGARQTAYRVLVASSEKLLSRDRGDIWDSGKVASDQSIQIETAGKRLESGEACFWKVRVWGASGRPSRWSASGIWTMGLLKVQDWKGKWIGRAPGATEREKQTPPPAPLMRKGFDIRMPVRRATAYICGLGYYELSLNGVKVGDHVLDPPITQYNKRALYVTYDVTRQLNMGRNAIGVELGSSWFNPTVPDVWNFYLAPWRALPQMRLQLKIEYADGSTQEVVSDETWKMATGPLLYDQTRVGEIYDARLEKPGWTTAAYDDSSWESAAVREGPKGVPAATNVEPIKVMETITPIKVSEPKPGVFVFDMGQNMTGWPQLTVHGAPGTSVRMMCGELLNADGTVNMSNINVFVRSSEFQADTYILKGSGVETWEPKFTYHGFQYIQVTGLPDKPDAGTIRGRVVHTAFEPAGSFACSNPLLNKIERAAVWSYISNFVGFPSDCPHREKNGWTGDAQLAVQMGLEHFHGEAAYTRWMNDIQDAQREDGKLPSITPTGGWGYDTLDGPAWESAFLLIPWELYQQSGDRRILENHYDSFRRWVDWYTRIAKNHIVNYGLGDWAPAKTRSPENVTSTAYYYRDLLIVARTADLLGHAEEAHQYRDLAEAVRQAFNATFFDPKTAQYAGGTQTTLACALYQGMANESDRERVTQNLVAKVQANNDHIDTGILGAKYILRALCDNGSADVAWKIATQTTRPSWGNWIERGATTLWEDWDGSSSHNHIMFGDISSWFIEYLAGIRLDNESVGYKKILIHPIPIGDLTSAQATRDCMYGRIFSAWNRVGDVFTLKITIPVNTSATVVVPAEDPEAVTESGRPVRQAEGVKILRREQGAVVFEVGSGKYEFRASVK